MLVSIKNKLPNIIILFFALSFFGCSNENKSTEIEKTSLKKSTLTSLIGEHNLVSITGFMGANTMFDYVIKNKKWEGIESSLIEGMREAYDIDLSDNKLTKLKTMKIVVSKDLTVSLFCNNKEYFKAPYNENGLTYFLKDSAEKYETTMSPKLNAKSTFIDEYLYLYAKDYINESEINYIDIHEIAANATVIRFNKKLNVFEMNLFYGDCCDNSIYTFK